MILNAALKQGQGGLDVPLLVQQLGEQQCGPFMGRVIDGRLYGPGLGGGQITLLSMHNRQSEGELGVAGFEVGAGVLVSRVESLHQLLRAGRVEQIRFHGQCLQSHRVTVLGQVEGVVYRGEQRPRAQQVMCRQGARFEVVGLHLDPQARQLGNGRRFQVGGDARRPGDNGGVPGGEGLLSVNLQ